MALILWKGLISYCTISNNLGIFLWIRDRSIKLNLVDFYPKVATLQSTIFSQHAQNCKILPDSFSLKVTHRPVTHYIFNGFFAFSHHFSFAYLGCKIMQNVKTWKCKNPNFCNQDYQWKKLCQNTKTSVVCNGPNIEFRVCVISPWIGTFKNNYKIHVTSQKILDFEFLPNCLRHWYTHATKTLIFFNCLFFWGIIHYPRLTVLEILELKI